MAIPKHLFSIPAILFVPQFGHETYYHFRDSVTKQLLHMTHNTQIKNSPCSTIAAIQFKYTDPVVLLYATYISTHLLCELVNHKIMC